jgi:hypothetical protein
MACGPLYRGVFAVFLFRVYQRDGRAGNDAGDGDFVRITGEDFDFLRLIMAMRGDIEDRFAIAREEDFAGMLIAPGM